jgi:hypothetical protein
MQYKAHLKLMASTNDNDLVSVVALDQTPGVIHDADNFG